jgi:hypothetical protein
MAETTMTYGIDLASQASRTATCLVPWHGDGPGVVETLRCGVFDVSCWRK